MYKYETQLFSLSPLASFLLPFHSCFCFPLYTLSLDQFSPVWLRFTGTSGREPILREGFFFFFIAPHQPRRRGEERRGVRLRFTWLCHWMSGVFIYMHQTKQATVGCFPPRRRESNTAEEDQVLDRWPQLQCKPQLFANKEAKFGKSAQGSTAFLQLCLPRIRPTTGSQFD